MPDLDLLHVDAFTDRAFAGNPAAVCFLDGPREAEWMQDVAREMGLSATAFLEPVDGGFHLRWFTPTVELELCGHGTLASAHALWETGRVEAEGRARFQSLSGALTAERQGEWIELDFPARGGEAADPPPALLAALGTGPGGWGRRTPRRRCWRRSARSRSGWARPAPTTFWSCLVRTPSAPRLPIS